MMVVDLILGLAAVGFVLWLLDRYVPMDATVKRIIHGVAVVLIFIWLLNAFGLFGHLSHVRIGR